MTFWLAIFGMICWGIAPLFAKVALTNVNPVAGLLLRTIFAATLICSWLGVKDSVIQIKSIPTNMWVLILIEAILATLVGDLAYFAAIKRGDVSMVSIIMASSPIVTLAGAAIFFGEPITYMRIVGAVFVVIGIALVM
ncbi:MAG: DMT family transporter [Hyphomonadaceae bacterium]|nr:DMT family transporter [Clostridia bacterium]